MPEFSLLVYTISVPRLSGLKEIANESKIQRIRA